MEKKKYDVPARRFQHLLLFAKFIIFAQFRIPVFFGVEHIF